MIKKGKLRKVNKQEKGNRISNNYSFIKNQIISQRKAIHKQKVSESGDFAIKETIGVDKNLIINSIFLKTLTTQNYTKVYITKIFPLNLFFFWVV